MCVLSYLHVIRRPLTFPKPSGGSECASLSCRKKGIIEERRKENEFKEREESEVNLQWFDCLTCRSEGNGKSKRETVREKI